MFHRLSWSCLGGDHLHFCVLNPPELIRKAAKKMSLLGLVDFAVGQLKLWLSLWLTSQTPFYSVVRKVPALCQPGQRSESFSLQMPFQEFLH